MNTTTVLMDVGVFCTFEGKGDKGKGYKGKGNKVKDVKGTDKHDRGKSNGDKGAQPQVQGYCLSFGV